MMCKDTTFFQISVSDCRLSALMVMSNIESTARNLEDGYAYLERADAVSAWLLNLPLEKIDSVDQNTLSTIGITEQELFEFIKMREKEIKLDRVEPDIHYTPNINPDSITTIQMP